MFVLTFLSELAFKGKKKPHSVRVALFPDGTVGCRRIALKTFAGRSPELGRRLKPPASELAVAELAVSECSRDSVCSAFVCVSVFKTL